MSSLDRDMELLVHLRKDVVHGDTVGMSLMDIYVPWKTRVKESHEVTGRLEDELGKVNVIMVALEIEKINVLKCERVLS